MTVNGIKKRAAWNVKRYKEIMRQVGRYWNKSSRGFGDSQWCRPQNSCCVNVLHSHDLHNDSGSNYTSFGKQLKIPSKFAFKIICEIKTILSIEIKIFLLIIWHNYVDWLKKKKKKAICLKHVKHNYSLLKHSILSTNYAKFKNIKLLFSHSEKVCRAEISKRPKTGGPRKASGPHEGVAGWGGGALWAQQVCKVRKRKKCRSGKKNKSNCHLGKHSWLHTFSLSLQHGYRKLPCSGERHRWKRREG